MGGLVGGIVLCLANGPLAAYTAYLIDKLHKKANNSSSEFSKKKNKWSVYHRNYLQIFPPNTDVHIREFVHVCEFYCGSLLKFMVNLGSWGAVTGAAIVYLKLIASFQLSIANFAHSE